MATATIDPVRLDRLIAIGGRATTRVAPGPQKRYAAALGISRTRACRHMQGDPHSPATRNLAYIYTLSRGRGTSPWPQIAEEIAVAKQAQIEDSSTELLVLRWWELTRREHTLEAAENDAVVSGSLEELADADVQEAEAALERAAISRELAARKVDPRAPKWRQVRDQERMRSRA
ncbi:MAG TPA: hypothetical protein VF158_04270 [Longimicrobiales bacterium]